MNIADDPTFEYVMRLRDHDDEISIVVKGHLLIEFIINLMIQKNCISPSVILNDHRSYTFSVKLQILYAMGLIPSHVYKNIRRVNKIRNAIAHNLEVNERIVDWKFDREDEEVKGELDIKSKFKGQRYPLRKYIKAICNGTLMQLRNLYWLRYGEFPSYRNHQAK